MKMATFGQLMVLFGLIISAIGGFIAYKYSSQDADQKHEDLLKKNKESINAVHYTEQRILTNQDTGFHDVKSKMQSIDKSLIKMEKKKNDTHVTISGTNNHTVVGDNNGINGDVHIDTPERKLDEQTLNSIIDLNKKDKPFKIIYYTNTEECRRFGVEVVNALKTRGKIVTFSARTAMMEINYPSDPTSNAAYEETEGEFIMAFYPLR